MPRLRQLCSTAVCSGALAPETAPVAGGGSNVVDAVGVLHDPAAFAIASTPHSVARLPTNGTPRIAAAKSAQRRNSLLPSHTTGSYLRSTTRSFMGISALSVILMFSGHTSVQHLVMLQ